MRSRSSSRTAGRARRGVPRRPAVAHRRGLPLRRALAARLRLERQADRARLGRSTDRASLGDPHGAARLRALRRTGFGLGHERQRKPRQQDRAHVAGVHLVPPLAPTGPGGDAGRRGRRILDPTPHPSANGRIRPDHSPAGLPRGSARRLRSWTNPSTAISAHQILDNVMHYWLPRTAASAARLYWEASATSPGGCRGPFAGRRPRPHPRRLQRLPARAAADPRGATPSSGSATSATGVSPTAAGTSPHGNNPPSSHTRSGPSSASSDNGDTSA